VHHTEERFRAVHQGDADAVARYTVYEVGGAIQWIDDPVEPFAFLAAAFLGDEACLRQDLLQGLHQPVLCGVVHVRHQVVRALARNARFGELSVPRSRMKSAISMHRRFDLFSQFLEVHDSLSGSCRLERSQTMPAMPTSIRINEITSAWVQVPAKGTFTRIFSMKNRSMPLNSRKSEEDDATRGDVFSQAPEHEEEAHAHQCS
jgi:hypothetical protein